MARRKDQRERIEVIALLICQKAQWIFAIASFVFLILWVAGA